ncbi:GNAT family N-acetyltransferase [Terrihabitans sp. B22-R8]|uniref:GNAT family N-acetyltransferase n=1 Tax=Terrihabitans sp. B22-R8 TaxID=3425128 RepID=UPI00403D461E
MHIEDRIFHHSEHSIPRTGRIALRRPRAADALGIVRVAHDRSIAENVASMPFPYTAADAQAWIASAARNECVAFVALADDEIVGGGGFVHGNHGAPELVYWIGAEHRGQGYGTELVRALVDYAFEAMGAERLCTSCRVTNPAGRRVVEKCGFQWAGCGLAGSVGFRGAFPVDRFRLDARIWESLVSWGQSRTGSWPGADLSAKADAGAVTL